VSAQKTLLDPNVLLTSANAFEGGRSEWDESADGKEREKEEEEEEEESSQNENDQTKESSSEEESMETL